MARTIVFPAMNADVETKLRSLLSKVGELMGDEINTESMIVVQVSVPDDRQDMLTVVNKIRAGMDRPKDTKSSKPVRPVPPPTSTGN